MLSQPWYRTEQAVYQGKVGHGESLLNRVSFFFLAEG